MDFKELFARTGIENTLIPLFDVQGEMLYYACNDKRNNNQELQTIVESVYIAGKEAKIKYRIAQKEEAYRIYRDNYGENGHK